MSFLRVSSAKTTTVISAHSYPDVTPVLGVRAKPQQNVIKISSDIENKLQNLKQFFLSSPTPAQQPGSDWLTCAVIKLVSLVHLSKICK